MPIIFKLNNCRKWCSMQFFLLFFFVFFISTKHQPLNRANQRHTQHTTTHDTHSHKHTKMKTTSQHVNVMYFCIKQHKSLKNEPISLKSEQINRQKLKFNWLIAHLVTKMSQTTEKLEDCRQTLERVASPYPTPYSICLRCQNKTNSVVITIAISWSSP